MHVHQITGYVCTPITYMNVAKPWRAYKSVKVVDTTTIVQSSISCTSLDTLYRLPKIRQPLNAFCLSLLQYLFLAAESGLPEMVSQLIKGGADVNWMRQVWIHIFGVQKAK